MVIHSARLTIRSVREEDWRDLQHIWSDFEHSEYGQYDVPHPLGDEEVRELTRKLAEYGLSFAVCLTRKHEAMIGHVDFHTEGDALDIGYCFDSAYHRQGYAKEGIRELIRLFSMIGIHRFTAGTGMANVPSVNLLRSLGFHQVGSEKVTFYKDPGGRDIYFDGGLFELNTAETVKTGS